MPETLTDAQKVMRNSTGIDIVTQLERIANGVSANINLGLTGAAVGDLVRVKTVDASGKPTSWEHVPLCDITTNENLLDNRNFANPVNQRGQNSWMNAGEYTVDRWKLTSGSASLGAGGLTLNGTLVQILDTAVGQPVTCSALLSDGSMITPTYNDSTKTFTLSATGQTIKAAKLEIGSSQTLAHQDADSNWVLNEIPDYGEELAKCQRYLVSIPNFAVREVSHTSNRIDYSLSLPVKPAGNMHIVDTSPLIVYDWAANTQQTGFSYELRLAASNMPNIRATKSSHGLSDSYLIATNLLLSCEQ